MAREQILVVDDEPHYLVWLEEYLNSEGYEVVFIETANEAVAMAAEKPFRAIVFDLNIPVSGPLKERAVAKGGLYATYPGLYLAFMARTAGFRSKQIIVYSVHSLEEIEAECRKLNCTYIPKGRPGIFKSELRDVLSYDPTKNAKKTVPQSRTSQAPAKGGRRTVGKDVRKK